MLAIPYVIMFASPFAGTLPIPLTGSQLTCYSSQVIMDGPIACSVQSSDPRIDIHFTNATLAGLKELFGTNMGRRAWRPKLLPSWEKETSEFLSERAKWSCWTGNAPPYSPIDLYWCWVGSGHRCEQWKQAAKPSCLLCNLCQGGINAGSAWIKSNGTGT